ncbi:Asp-tRNA(Asn)/Glu-tRNA(Gln) amidotransferase subunit GatC [Candidatus Nomurabacteria bacterium]|nr:Asp-tRNA(Asn)/Glu-tRNA(Gln) amidotransferase subunit GatC [Candidatus Nomurabacteria bacterium]
MKLSREDILKLAKLSRLDLTDAEVERFRAELSSILDYVEQLDSVDVSGLKPTYQVTGLTSLDKNVTRVDKVTEQVSHDELMKNVPDSDGRHIKVKRMVV